MKRLPARDVKDERVRCPMCVLYDQDLLLTTERHWKSAKFGNRLGSFRDADVIKPPSRTARRRRAKKDGERLMRSRTALHGVTTGPVVQQVVVGRKVQTQNGLQCMRG